MNEKDDLDNFFFYTPEIFYKDSNILIKKIINDTPESEPFDIILGVARGGLVLAYYVASKLNISKFYTIKLKSYHNMKQNEIEIIQEPPWEKIKGKKVLIIEDLIDKGNTAKLIFNLLKIHQIENYKLAVLVDKQKNPNIKPDFFIRHMKNWVLFFWEQSYSNKRM
jgi:hypoxanthine phosphoribosyltransferase